MPEMRTNVTNDCVVRCAGVLVCSAARLCCQTGWMDRGLVLGRDTLGPKTLH